MMAYVHIEVYRLARPANGLTRESAAEEMLPVYTGQPGFLDHEMLVSVDEVISISRWQSREHATEGSVHTAAWVKGHLDGQLTLEQQYTGAAAGFARR